MNFILARPLEAAAATVAAAVVLLVAIAPALVTGPGATAPGARPGSERAAVEWPLTRQDLA